MNFSVKEYIDETTNWNYQSISTKVITNGIKKELCYGSINKGETRFLEIYQGENYIVNSKDPSRSWKYNEDKIPQKWKELTSLLRSAFNTTFIDLPLNCESK